MRKSRLNLFWLILLLAFGSFLSLSSGLYVWHRIDFVSKSLNDAQLIQIIWNIRFPRLLVGILSGGLFALAGSIFQTVYRNKVASPDLLGINALAIFSILVFSLIWPRDDLILLYALIGTIIGFGFIVILSGVRTLIVSSRLIILGLALSLVFRALSQLIVIKADQNQQSLLFFLNGSLANASWQSFTVCLVPAVILIILSLLFSRYLAVMQLSPEVVSGIGMNLYLWQLIYLGVGLLMSAVAVSLSGSLGFIGLIAPNLARAIVAPARISSVLLFSMLCGSCLTVFADWLGKTLIYPNEIPAGILMIFVGTPVFIYLLKNMGWNLKNE